MQASPLSQRARVIVLVTEAAILFLASFIALGQAVPPNNAKGFWFYTGLLGLVLGSRLVTPFYVKPADAIVYAVPAAVSLALVNQWAGWDSGRKVAFVLSMLVCIVTALMGALAILGKDSANTTTRRLADAARVLAADLGKPRFIYSVLIAFAIYAFHSESAREVGILALAWVVTAMLSPLEEALNVWNRLRRVMRSELVAGEIGKVAGYQVPGIVLVRETTPTQTASCDVLAIKDPFRGTRFVIALDRVGRDEGVLLRTIEVPDVAVDKYFPTIATEWNVNECYRIDLNDDVKAASILITSKENLIGLVAPDTSMQKLLFEVVATRPLSAGMIVEVNINDRSVIYQLLDGLTREEIVQQKNTFGFVRAQAQKIGEWDGARKRFRAVNWLPQPNAPVLLREAADFKTTVEAIGHFPGTDHPVTLRAQNGEASGLHFLVTHNTAILGILGIGKSYIALELVERMMAEGVKVVCLDLTNQYASELAPYYDATANDVKVEKLKAIGVAGKANVKKNVQEGGSRTLFANAVRDYLNAFIASADPRRLVVFNPAQFEVWRQDSKPFGDTASMVSLTPAEITQIVSEATLEIVSSMGMTDKARVCIVYEEAHSLVPEWSSAVAEGDRAAANGTSRAILQGRKYGLGCLLITQRTANVTKTILNQCNSIFAMRTFDDTGKEFLANYLGRTYAEVLPTLEERHAIFFGRASACENPVLIRANDRDAFLAVFRAAHPPPEAPIHPANAEGGGAT